MDYHKELTKRKIMLEATDPMNPDVSVEGLGTYDLKTLKTSTRRNIEDLLDSLLTDDPRTWRNAKYDMESGVITAKIAAIVAAHDDLQRMRSRGGPRSRGIDKE